MNIISQQDTVQNPSLLTPWSFVHFSSGVVAKTLNIDFLTFIVLNVLYETKDIFFTHGENSWQNSITDILLGIFGYYSSNKITLVLSAIFIILFDKFIKSET